MASTTLSASALAKARRNLTSAYPFLRRAKADVQSAPNDCFLLKFQVTTEAPGGGTIRQQVRATVSAKGDVLKVVTSR